MWKVIVPILVASVLFADWQGTGNAFAGALTFMALGVCAIAVYGEFRGLIR